MKKYENRKNRVIGKYEFVPEYNRWVDMERQRKIVKKLENITDNEKNQEF